MSWRGPMVASCAAALLVADGGMAHIRAQESEPVLPEAQPPTILRLPSVSVIGSKEEALGLPGSAHYLDVEDIRDQNYDDINRVLRRVPGVYVREEDGHGLFPNISLRGVDGSRSSKVTIMEDGVLSAPAPYSAPAAYYRPTTGRMAGIEVLKGSSQVRYGPHTTGGVINFLSTPIPTGKSEGYIRSTFGRDNDLRVHGYWGGNAATDIGRIGYLVEGFFRTTDGFKTIDAAPDFTDTDDTGFTIAEPMVKLSWEPNTRLYQHLELKVGHTDLDANETYLGLTEDDFAADPFRRYSATRFDNIVTEQTRTYARHYIEVNEWLGVTNTLYYNEFARNWFKLQAVNGNNLSRAIAGGGADLATLRGEAAGTLTVRANNRRYYGYGAQSMAEIDFDTGALNHEVTIGLRYHKDAVRRFQNDDVFTQAANGAIIAVAPGVPGGAGDRKQETAATAVSLEDRIAIGRWTFSPGVRVEYLDLKTWEPTFEAEGEMTVWAGGAGATYDVDDRTTVFGGVFRGFSVPGPRAALRDDLDEETSIAYEIGVRHNDPSRGYGVELVGFRTDFTDLIVVDNIGATGSGGTENVGDITSQGVELSLNWDPGIANGLTFGIPTFVAFTYTDARLSGDSLSTDAESLFSGGRDGNRVPYVPEYQVTFGAGLQFDRWSASFTATYVPEMFTTASNTRLQVDNAGRPDARFGVTDSHFLLDIAGSVEVAENFKLIGGVQNLLDEEYVASRHPHGPRPGMPRFFYVGLEGRF